MIRWRAQFSSAAAAFNRSIRMIELLLFFMVSNFSSLLLLSHRATVASALVIIAIIWLFSFLFFISLGILPEIYIRSERRTRDMCGLVKLTPKNRLSVCWPTMLLLFKQDFLLSSSLAEAAYNSTERHVYSR